MIAGWTYYEMLVENRVSDFEAGLAAKGNTLLQEAGEVLLSQLDEIDRLTKIVDGLTLLAKADTGQGIPADKLSRVFDPFYRGETTPADGEDGCGLGLAIAQWIVRAHGGKIEIRSVPHQVTRVSIRFPENPAPVGDDAEWPAAFAAARAAWSASAMK